MTRDLDPPRAGDPRYDGFRIQALWAWTMVDPADNQEGIVGLVTPDGALPLIASDRVRLTQLRGYAQDVARAKGRPVLLRRFVPDGDPLEVLDP